MIAIAADTDAGLTTGIDHLADALLSLRRRMLDVAERLSPDDWGRPSRCHLWSAHDVVRHVRDACRIHVDRLSGSAQVALEQPFDPRTTPLRWLERTAGESPAATVGDLQDLSPVEDQGLRAWIGKGTDRKLLAPYGLVHWSVLSAHIFWDAWLHERDISLALDLDSDPPVVEELVSGFYALLIASIPAMHLSYPLQCTVALDGASGRRHVGQVTPGRVELHTDDPSLAVDLHGDLGAVVDSLAGRGPHPRHVLVGDPALIEPLTWVRSLMIPED